MRIVSSRTKRRQFSIALSAIGLSLVFVFLVGEMASRFFFPDTQLRYVSDPEALFFYEPNQNGTLELSDGVTKIPVQVNQLGFRGGPIHADGRKILVLGDSFTFGWGVQDHETFSAKLGEWFSEEVTVINGGQPGYGIFQMGATLKRVGEALRPDLVILVIWQGDLLRQPLEGDERVGFFKRQRISRILKHSVFVTHVYRSFEKLFLIWGLDSFAFSVGEGGRGNTTADPEVIRDQYRRGWSADRPRILKMQEEARRYGKGLLLVLWPKEDFASIAEEGLAGTLTETIQGFSANHGMPFVSVQSAMRSVSPKSLLMVPRDLHPSVLAHCLAAEVLALKLQVLGVVKPRQVTCTS